MSGLDRGCYARRISSLLFCLFVMMNLMGCLSDSEVLDEQKADELKFQIGILRSKATDIAFERLDKIGIYAVTADPANNNPLLPSGNYADNRCYKLANETDDWVSEQPVLFPADGSLCDVYGYYPWQEVALTSNTSLTLRVQADQVDYANYTASDFMVAYANNVQKTSDEIPLTFSHKLSQMVFELKNGRNCALSALREAQVKIKNAVVEGSYDLSTGNDGLPVAGHIRADIKANGSFGKNSSGDRLVGVKAIMIPQQLTTDTYIEITIGDRVFLKKFPIPLTLNSGESRRFIITINDMEGEDSDSDITTDLNPWDEGGIIEGEAEEYDDGSLIKMTTLKQQIQFDFIIANSDIIIDWGDGQIDTNVFSHNYAEAVEHTIVFYGASTALNRFYCEYCELTSLDIHKATGLVDFRCHDNFLTALDVRSNVNLQFIGCFNNQIRDLDVTKNIELKVLGIFNNPISNIDISQNTLLESFNANDTQIGVLEASHNPYLWDIYIKGTVLENDRVQLINLANTLSDRSGLSAGQISINENSWEIIRPILQAKNWSRFAW